MIDKMSLIRDQYSFCWRNQSIGVITRECFTRMKKLLKLIWRLHRPILRLSGCVLSNQVKSMYRLNLGSDAQIMFLHLAQWRRSIHTRSFDKSEIFVNKN